MAAIERNPGIEAATSDLYAAASAVVNDTVAASQPKAKKRRLLKDAGARFKERIVAARPNQRGAAVAWRQNELFLAA